MIGLDTLVTIAKTGIIKSHCKRVVSYIENINACDFPAAVALFVADGELKPPLQQSL